MEEKTRILIDVDGVLNPDIRCNVNFCGCHPGWRRFYATSETGIEYKISLSAWHGSLLTDLAMSTDGLLTWYTTWNETANQFAGAAGLPRLPVIHCPRVPPPLAKTFTERGEGWGAWKAQKLAPQAEWPFVWFDDEPDARTEALRHITVPHLVVTVDSRTGLLPEHIEQARRWLREGH